jgi:hypothetical protein
MGPNEKKIFEAICVAPNLDVSTDVYFRLAIQFYGLPVGYQGNQVNIKFIK